MKKILVGHTTPETAFIQEDYPYSFQLRCRRRIWIETRKGFGQRVLFQTTNPRKGDIWNKPKAGTYLPLSVIYLDEENGHVEVAGLSGYAGSEEIEKFASDYAEALTGEYEQRTLKVLRAARKVDKQLTYQVVTGEAAKLVPSQEEQQKMYRGLVVAQLHKDELKDK